MRVRFAHRNGTPEARMTNVGPLPGMRGEAFPAQADAAVSILQRFF